MKTTLTLENLRAARDVLCQEPPETRYVHFHGRYWTEGEYWERVLRVMDGEEIEEAFE